MSDKVTISCAEHNISGLEHFVNIVIVGISLLVNSTRVHGRAADTAGTSSHRSMILTQAASIPTTSSL